MFATVAVIVVVVAVGLALLAVKWKPVRKKWCVMLYFDGRDGDPTGTYLEAKLQQVLTDLENLPCNSKSSEQAEPT